MNPRKVTIALTAMIAFSPIAKAQKPQGAPPSRADILKAARDVMNDPATWRPVTLELH